VRGLSCSQVRGVVETRLAPNAHAYDDVDCDQALRKVWGGQHDANARLLADLLRAEEKRRPGLVAALAAANLDYAPMVFVELVMHHTARAAARKK
jgi:hypothetical protein